MAEVRLTTLERYVYQCEVPDEWVKDGEILEACMEEAMDLLADSYLYHQTEELTIEVG